MPEDPSWNFDHPQAQVQPKGAEGRFRELISSIEVEPDPSLGSNKVWPEMSVSPECEWESIKPLVQSNSVSSGQTSVAMCLNVLKGIELRDTDIDEHYGFRLLDALKSESPARINWKDVGNLSEATRQQINKTHKRGLPVIVAVNGPRFSKSGRGEIITLVDSGDREVSYADPADGRFKTCTWEELLSAEQHPDGNFVFLPLEVSRDSGHLKGRPPGGEASS